MEKTCHGFANYENYDGLCITDYAQRQMTGNDNRSLITNPNKDECVYMSNICVELTIDSV